MLQEPVTCDSTMPGFGVPLRGTDPISRTASRSNQVSAHDAVCILAVRVGVEDEVYGPQQRQVRSAQGLVDLFVCKTP